MNIQEHDITEYIEKLPEDIKKIIFSLPWEDRTREIAKKYSLTPEQTESLVDIVTCALVGLEKGDDIPTHIAGDLGISKLLTGQILIDLDKRVFDLVLSHISRHKEDVESSESNTPPQHNEDQHQAGEEHVLHTNQTNTLVQKPIDVPRFNLQEEKKLETPTTPTPEVPPKTTSPTYTIDPYREPLA